MNAEVTNVLGCLCPPGTRCFQRLGGFPAAPSPVPLRDRVHPFMSCTSPSEYGADYHLPGTKPSASHGVPPPIRDISMQSLLNSEFPTPAYVSPTAFLTLPTIYSFTYVVGLFHPTATSGIHTSGDFPAAKPACLIDKSCPHVVSGILLPASKPTGARSNRPTFRALVRAAIRCEQQGG
jgi:hypothetical protein